MADPTLSQLIGGLLGYGPVGLGFGVCGFVIWTLYQRNLALSDKVTELAIAANQSQLSTANAIQTLTEVVKAGKAA